MTIDNFPEGEYYCSQPGGKANACSILLFNMASINGCRPTNAEESIHRRDSSGAHMDYTSPSKAVGLMGDLALEDTVSINLAHLMKVRNDKYIYPELPERPSFDNSANIKQPAAK
jgi:hypothetical protein